MASIPFISMLCTMGGDYSRRVLRHALVPKKRLFFVPYSVDTPYFVEVADRPGMEDESQKIKESLGWSDCFPIILFIGQLSWVKGPDIAVQVFQQYYEKNSKARLLVVGNWCQDG